MMKWILSFLGPLAAGTILATGCAYSHQAEVREPATLAVPNGELVVVEHPPAPEAEIVGNAPDEHHVWVEGYWAHPNERWVWIPGHWDVPPRVGVKWVPGHWDPNDDGSDWIWTPGYWE